MSSLIGFSGILDPMLKKMAACGNARDDSHMCRNLHKLIESSSRSLPIQISTTSVPIRLSRRGRPLKKAVVEYPILLPSHWAQMIFRTGGHFFLGGSSMDQIGSFQNILEKFWSNYKQVEPAIAFQGSPRLAIPYCLHGDEGRGKGKKPVMVLGLQPIITSPDMSTSNLSGYLINMKSEFIPLLP